MQRALLRGGGGWQETTDSFIANDFSVLFRGAEGGGASMTSPAHFHSADAGVWLIAGVAPSEPPPHPHTEGVRTLFPARTLARY